MFEWNNWWGTLAAVGIAIFANVVLAVVLMGVRATAGKRIAWLRPLILDVRSRTQMLVFLAGLWIAFGLTAPAEY